MREERLTEGEGREGRAGKKGADDDLIIMARREGGERGWRRVSFWGSRGRGEDGVSYLLLFVVLVGV